MDMEGEDEPEGEVPTPQAKKQRPSRHRAAQEDAEQTEGESRVAHHDFNAVQPSLPVVWIQQVAWDHLLLHFALEKAGEVGAVEVVEGGGKHGERREEEGTR